MNGAPAKPISGSEGQSRSDRTNGFEDVVEGVQVVQGVQAFEVGLCSGSDYG